MSPLGDRPAGGTSGDIEVEIRGAALCLRLRSHGRNGEPTRRHVYNVIEMQLRGESGQLFDWLSAGQESQSSIHLYLRIPKSRLPFAGRQRERHVS